MKMSVCVDAWMGGRKAESLYRDHIMSSWLIESERSSDG